MQNIQWSLVDRRSLDGLKFWEIQYICQTSVNSIWLWSKNQFKSYGNRTTDMTSWQALLNLYINDQL